MVSLETVNLADYQKEADYGEECARKNLLSTWPSFLETVMKSR